MARRVSMSDARGFGRAGAVQPLRTGVSPEDLAADLAALEDVYAPLVATINNYFPDGAVSDDALIDTENEQDYDVHVWQGQLGTEVLAFAAGGGPGPDNAVSVTLPGDAWGVGVYARDWTNRYGCGEIPAGRYRVGVTVRSSDPLVARLSANFSAGNAEYAPEVIFPLDSQERRFVLDVYLKAAGGLGFALAVLEGDQPAGATEPDATIYCSHVMVTEGDPAKFADGDSSGWSWSGTAYASPSSGPQP